MYSFPLENIGIPVQPASQSTNPLDSFLKNEINTDLSNRNSDFNFQSEKQKRNIEKNLIEAYHFIEENYKRLIPDKKLPSLHKISIDPQLKNFSAVANPLYREITFSSRIINYNCSARIISTMIHELAHALAGIQVDDKKKVISSGFNNSLNEEFSLGSYFEESIALKFEYQYIERSSVCEVLKEDRDFCLYTGDTLPKKLFDDFFNFYELNHPELKPRFENIPAILDSFDELYYNSSHSIKDESLFRFQAKTVYPIFDGNKIGTSPYDSLHANMDLFYEYCSTVTPKFEQKLLIAHFEGSILKLKELINSTCNHEKAFDFTNKLDIYHVLDANSSHHPLEDGSLIHAINIFLLSSFTKILTENLSNKNELLDQLFELQDKWEEERIMKRNVKL